MLPATAALAALEEGTPTPAARTIPVAPVDPGSTAGRIVLGVADWLEQRLGSGSEGVRLALDAPMWAEERDGTYVLHLPGARLVEPTVPLVQWELGDLAVAVTPRGEATYDFETALPPVIDKGEERLTIGEGTVSGTWRSDLDVTTRLEADATNLRLSEGKGARTVETLSLGALSVDGPSWSRATTGCGTVAPRLVFRIWRARALLSAGSKSRAASRTSIAIWPCTCAEISVISRAAWEGRRRSRIF